MAKKTKETPDTSATPVVLSPTRYGTKASLSEVQRERLTILIEEASEVQKEACKILRFGFDDKNPLLEGAVTNRENLEREIGDFNNAVRMMIAAGDIQQARIDTASTIKREMIAYWSSQPKEVL